MKNIYIINLARSEDRKKQMQEKLKKKGIKAVFVEGIDGLGKKVENFSPQYNPLLRKKTFGRHMRPTEIACSLSHLKALKIAYDNGDEKIAIFEDDIVFLDDFIQGLDLCFSLPEKYECVRLYAGSNRKFKVVLSTKKIKIARIFRNVVGTQGYYINRSGIKKALENGYPIMYSWDKYIFGYWLIQINVFCTKRNIVKCAGEEIAPSTIDYSVKDKYETRGNKIARMTIQMKDEFRALVFRLKHFKDFY